MVKKCALKTRQLLRPPVIKARSQGAELEFCLITRQLLRHAVIKSWGRILPSKFYENGDLVFSWVSLLKEGAI